MPKMILATPVAISIVSNITRGIFVDTIASMKKTYSECSFVNSGMTPKAILRNMRYTAMIILNELWSVPFTGTDGVNNKTFKEVTQVIQALSTAKKKRFFEVYTGLSEDLQVSDFTPKKKVKKQTVDAKSKLSVDELKAYNYLVAKIGKK